MKVKATELIRKAAILMGDNPETMVSQPDCEAPTLSECIALQIEIHATEALLATPRNQIDGWKQLDTTAISVMEDGSISLPLPDDFLMLLCLRLKGWLRSVTEVHFPDSPRALLLGNPVNPLRASAQRPLAVMTASDKGRALRLYGKHSFPTAFDEAWYLPAPRIDEEGFIELPQPTINLLLKGIAGLGSKTACQSC